MKKEVGIGPFFNKNNAFMIKTVLPWETVGSMAQKATTAPANKIKVLNPIVSFNYFEALLRIKLFFSSKKVCREQLTRSIPLKCSQTDHPS